MTPPRPGETNNTQPKRKTQMDIQVTGRNVSVSEELKAYVADKLLPVLENYPRVESCHAVLSLEKYRQTASIVVQGRDKMHIEAAETADDMYAAIDGAVLRADKQLRKSRQKMIERQQGLSDGRQRLTDIEPPHIP